MREVYVVGVGLTRFGKEPGRTLQSMGRESSRLALIDAGIGPEAVELIACGTARSGTLQRRESGVGQLIGWEVGIQGVPVYNLKAYCASGASAFNVAYMSIAGGFTDVALVVGVEKLTDRVGAGRPLTSDGAEIEGDLGFTPPVYYAAAASRHMQEYGTTPEQLATVAVKNRQAGALNPIAQYTKPITIESVLDSRRVVGPLHLLDCCPSGDGGAAVIVMSHDAVLRYGVDAPLVRVAASVIRSGEYGDQQREMSSFRLDRIASTLAYEAAGLGPDDIDVAEVHDAFTIAELIHYEDLGFCSVGEAGNYVSSGATSLGGARPVNTSGGLLSRGHPLGATGVAQIAELTQQLRGRADARQVTRAEVGLAQVSGGFLSGDFATSAVTILTSPGRSR
jgi:acetyl-CoA acetyltransferase